MTDNVERIAAQLDLDPPYCPRAVDGWPGVQVERRHDVILVQAPHDLATAALDAWYGRVVDGSYHSPAESESDWEACRAAVRQETITFEQLGILLGLAGAKSS